MNLSILGKISTIIKYLFSSFLSIEIFIFTLLLFLVLLLTINKNNKFLHACIIAIYIGFLIGIIISYNTYVGTCVDSFTKGIMNYIYFPSPFAYFFIILFSTVVLIYSIYNKKLSKVKKIINYILFNLMYFLFMSFIAIASSEKLDLVDKTNLYSNDIVLSIVQVSNFLLVIWIIFTLFYRLFLYFKKKYD